MAALRKIICSIGAGPHAELLAISGETFRVYAERHSYDLCLRNDTVSGRPVSWSKIRLIETLLAKYDLVLWIDADAAVIDPLIDVATLLDRRELMGLVTHATPEGDDRIPNCGVWLLRRHRKTRRFLEDVWGATAYIDHKWWENAAVLDLLGYELEPSVRLVRSTPMYSLTRFLPTEWNSISVDPSPTPRIVHFAGLALGDRLAGLRAAAERLGQANGYVPMIDRAVGPEAWSLEPPIIADPGRMV